MHEKHCDYTWSVTRCVGTHKSSARISDIGMQIGIVLFFYNIGNRCLLSNVTQACNTIVVLNQPKRLSVVDITKVGQFDVFFFLTQLILVIIHQ